MKKFAIAIEDRADDAEGMADLLENIADQIRDGMTSGYYPHWSLVEVEAATDEGKGEPG